MLFRIIFIGVFPSVLQELFGLVNHFLFQLLIKTTFVSESFSRGLDMHVLSLGAQKRMLLILDCVLCLKCHCM